jgi:hypothetical protein
MSNAFSALRFCWISVSTWPTSVASLRISVWTSKIAASSGPAHLLRWDDDDPRRRRDAPEPQPHRA